MSFADLAERLKKPKPRLLEKRARKAAIETEDKKQRKFCRLRSGGRCEVIEVRFRPEASAIFSKRCARRASQNHHLLGGVGRRNVGESILAKHRLDTCDLCHTEIEHAVLIPVDQDKAKAAATVRYERRQ